MSLLGFDLLDIELTSSADTPTREPKDTIAGDFGFSQHPSLSNVADPVHRWDPGTPLSTPGTEEDHRSTLRSAGR